MDTKIPCCDGDECKKVLSPEVLKFACLIQAKLHASRKTGVEDVWKDSTNPGLYKVGKSLRLLYNEIVRSAQKIMDAVSHHSVTDRGLFPLSSDHIDRNPRRVQQVLDECVNQAVLCLAMAEACGALDTEPTEKLPAILPTRDVFLTSGIGQLRG